MVTDAMIEAALAAAKGFRPGWMRAALEAAERARDAEIAAGAAVLFAGRLQQSESAVDPLALFKRV